MLKHRQAISIVVTALMAAILALVTVHSLWITVPLFLFMCGSDLDENIIGSIVFAVMLDIFAFSNSIWFGIAYLVLSVIALVSLEDYYGYCGVIFIVLFNIGIAICGEWSIWLYAIPSLIAIFLFLLRTDFSFVYNFFLSLLSTEEQISALESLSFHSQCNIQFERRLNNLKQKLATENKRKEEYLQMCEENRQRQEFRKKYVNDDMVRIEQLLAGIQPKIEDICNFNYQLQNVIKEYEEKAIIIIEESYRSMLGKLLMPRNSYFRNFDKISRNHASELNPVLATACETSVKKVAAFISQKQEIINKNNDDIAKYNRLMQNLQRLYNDELALNKIKEINSDVNSQMEDTSDTINKEIKNSEIQNIISDINLLDNEVKERRHYEIQFGQIEI